MDPVGVEDVTARGRMKTIGDSFDAQMEMETMQTTQAESNQCCGMTGRVINLLQVIAGEAMPDEAATLVRERISRAAALHPSGCLADFVRHLSDVALLSPFLARLNGNLLHGADIEAFFSVSAPDGSVH